MRVVGIIAEYNPFHNGHLWQMEQAKIRCGADTVICLMSGHFTQRGEPAVVNKWVRAAMALECGADIVIELPTAYALSSARNFAGGAVQLLTMAGIVDYLCFGSESSDINQMTMLATILADEPEEYRTALRTALKTGVPFPTARLMALTQWLQYSGSRTTELNALLAQPNNILALEYLSAIKRYNSHLKPVNVPRQDAAYHSKEIQQKPIASATAIRHHLSAENNLFTIAHTVPQPTQLLLEQELNAGRGPVSIEMFGPTILTLLRKMEPAQIAVFPDIETGLEHRIKKAAQRATSLTELLELVKTKRYTWTRLQRILFAILLDYNSTARTAVEHLLTPQYLRVLGFRQTAQPLLKRLQHAAALPVLTKITPHTLYHSPPVLREMLALDILATDLYVLAYPAATQRKGGLDYTHRVVRV